MEEIRNKAFVRKKIVVVFFGALFLLLLLFIRLLYLMVFESEHYSTLAQQLHERERGIKAARGRILDVNGTVIADNKTVCTVSVIHSQIKDEEAIIQILSEELGLSEDYIQKRVEKISSIEKIKSNVAKEIGDRIREYKLDGVKVDEDYKRFYPFDSLASKVLGFTGGDNQGIIGLEVIYERYLEGVSGTILTVTDAKGVEIEAAGENRKEPINGNDLQLSLDMNIQSYATQLAYQSMETKEADSVSILVMNVKTGEMLTMVNVPEFNLNQPYELPNGIDSSKMKAEEKQNYLNQMWRNGCINDTYEPGSTFKIITAAAALEEKVVTPESPFSCPGFVMVEDRKIRCHKTTGHGGETFMQATMNSCNPVFVTVGLRLGAEIYYNYFKEFGLLTKTGIDLPGEAASIMHKLDKIGMVELATISFGQSFQITPIQLMATAAGIINEGTRVIPHFGVRVLDQKGELVEEFQYAAKQGIISKETSDTMKMMLEKVVAEGGGFNGRIEGYRIGGKTATSQTLPRGSGKYISSFVAFAPADNPQIIAMVIINNPKGVYYGGQIAAPVIRQLFENILPYLGIMSYNG